MTDTIISIDELGRHSDVADGWLALNGVVWNFTDFAIKHPGGPLIIEQHLGKDGSSAYNEIHSPGLVMHHLGEQKKLGLLERQDPTTVASGDTSPSSRNSDTNPLLPSLDSITNLRQFTVLAEQALTEKAFGYISSATEEGFSHAANEEYHRRVWFRPRVLKCVGEVDITTSFLGHRLSCPILVAPTSSIKLTHRDGEVAVAKASQRSAVPAIVPSMGSYSVSEVVNGLEPGYPFFLQLYVQRNRAETERLLDESCRLGARAIIVTVDLPVLSKREIKSGHLTPGHESARPASQRGRNDSGNAPTPANTVIDPDLCWEDIRWIIQRTKLPVIIKGVQCAEDARRALLVGCAGVYLSNHGGRALDTSPPAILTLLEIHKTCPDILDKMEIMVDGGFRRGSDVLKAICLGANLVCIGRPFLYSLAYGEAGVVRAFEILKEELTTAMQLLGITSLRDVSLAYLNTSQLEMLLPSAMTLKQLKRNGSKL